MITTWESLIRFEAEDESIYWAALPLDTPPTVGLTVDGFTTIEELESGGTGIKTAVKTVLFPQNLIYPVSKTLIIPSFSLQCLPHRFLSTALA